MSSHNILNRLLPTGGGGSGSGRGTRQRERPSRSFYEELRGGGDHDDDDDDDGARDIEIEAGLDLDEENLKHAYTDADLERALGGVVDDSQPDVSGGRGRGRKPPSGNRDPTQERGRGGGGGGGIGVGRGSGAVAGAGGGAAASRWLARDYDDGDNNDVPASLLVEHHDIDPLPTRGPVAGGGGRGTARSGGHQGRQQQAAVPGPSTARNRALWDNTMAQQRLHPEDSFGMAGPKASAGARDGSGGARPTALLSFVARGDRRQRALWRWTNVTNLDIFVKDVYDYYLGAGIWCILLERVLHLM